MNKTPLKCGPLTAKVTASTADFRMHYLNRLSDKLVTAYQNHENVLNPTSRGMATPDPRILSDALRAVLEQEVEGGRLRYNLLHEQQNEADPAKQTEPFFAELLLYQG